MNKNIFVLGSNNPLGITALDFLKNHLNKFVITGLSYDSAANNLDLFIKQIKEFNIKTVYVDDPNLIDIIENKVDVKIYNSQSNFSKFIKENDVDDVFCSLSGIDSVKKILSIIHELKDITLLNTSPILYSGRIIPLEAQSKGVKLNIFSYTIYSIDKFLYLNRLNDINKIFIYTLKRKDSDKKIDILDFNNFSEFAKNFYSVNKIRVVNDLFLLNYIYNIPLDKISISLQSKRFASLGINFSNNSSLLNIANQNIQSIFNYYFLDSSTTDSNDSIGIKLDDFDVSFSKLDLNKEKYLKLGLEALERSGSIPIIYYITVETVTKLIYYNKLKKNVTLLKILKEVMNMKKLYSKYPDLSTIYSIENKVINYVNSKYTKKEKS